MVRKVGIIIFLTLLAVLVVVSIYIFKYDKFRSVGSTPITIVKKANDQAGIKNLENLGRTDGTKNIELPIALDSKNVGQVFIHYFLSGPIKEIRNIPQGAELVIDTEDKSVLPVRLGGDVRVSKISPPFRAANIVSLGIKDLKAGLIVDISIEYDVRSKVWVVRDVFIPTDRNRNL